MTGTASLFGQGGQSVGRAPRARTPPPAMMSGRRAALSSATIGRGILGADGRGRERSRRRSGTSRADLVEDVAAEGDRDRAGAAGDAAPVGLR